MIEYSGKIAEIIHGLFIILSAFWFLVFWYRTRLWLPRYVHIIAILSFILGIGMLHMVPTEAPIYSSWGKLAPLFIVFILPAAVYFSFIFYGGQYEAYKSKSESGKIKCIYCSYEYSDTEECPNCHQHK